MWNFTFPPPRAHIGLHGSLGLSVDGRDSCAPPRSFLLLFLLKRLSPCTSVNINTCGDKPCTVAMGPLALLLRGCCQPCQYGLRGIRLRDIRLRGERSLQS